jgi:LysR family hydrogen peroxide-inducible transcriptional activator
MTLQELRYLVAVAEEGQVARAAERCHVGQPTLSTQLKKLEDTLGVQLFERGPRGLKPTAAGAPIIAQARVVLEEAAKLRTLARARTSLQTVAVTARPGHQCGRSESRGRQ